MFLFFFLFSFTVFPVPIFQFTLSEFPLCSQSAIQPQLFPVSNYVSCSQYLITSALYNQSPAPTTSADHCMVSSNMSRSPLCASCDSKIVCNFFLPHQHFILFNKCIINSFSFMIIGFELYQY